MRITHSVEMTYNAPSTRESFTQARDPWVRESTPLNYSAPATYVEGVSPRSRGAD